MLYHFSKLQCVGQSPSRSTSKLISSYVAEIMLFSFNLSVSAQFVKHWRTVTISAIAIIRLKNDGKTLTLYSTYHKNSISEAKTIVCIL